MKIAFHVDSFGLRGVDQATLQYCLAAEQILGFDVVVIRSHRAESLWVTDHLEKQYRDSFRVLDYSGNRKELIDLLEYNRIEMLYTLTCDGTDERFSGLEVPVIRHTVFPTSRLIYQQERFAVISKWLSREFFNNKATTVPHIITKPCTSRNIRGELGIPDGDLVLGSMGGRENFNSMRVIDGLRDALDKRPDLWMLGMNQDIPIQHNRVILLPGSANVHRKWAFINSCDFMLHGRVDGETFGIACGEFSKAGKPLIAWTGTPQRAHIEQFLQAEYGFGTKKELSSLLLGLEKCYRAEEISRIKADAFSSVHVAQQFKDAFIDVVEDNSSNHTLVDSLITDFRYMRRRVRVRNSRRDLFLP